MKNNSSQTEIKTTAAEPVENGHPNGRMNSHPGSPRNGHAPSGCLNTGSQNSAELRERTVSSSSSDIDTDRQMHRKNRNRKNEAVKQKAAPNSSCPTSHASCQDCQTDLTDSDVEVCQDCFGLRKQKIDTNMDEYCPFPLHFLKKKHVPEWFFEPEYVNWHPKVRTENKDGEHTEKDKKQAVHEKVHRNTDSLLSTTSNFTNYRGLLNLCLLLLVLSNARLCVENLLKYGVLINPVYIVQNCFENLNNWPNAKILLYQAAHPLIAFSLQYHFLSKGRLSEWAGAVVTFLNGLVQLTYPAWMVLREHPNPVFSSFTLAIVTILFLKLISYAHVHYWCRKNKHQVVLRRRQSSSGEQNGERSERSGDQDSLTTPMPVRYPDNLTLKDLTYFVLAPTLCYELNFPRSARIRKRFLLKRTAEMIFLITVIIGLVQQWIVPIIRNSLQPLSNMDFFKCIERLLKLALPNHFIWLLFFYAFFHSMLNVLAELLKFGDRDFYQDWWNSETISDFWKNWNIPVHRWANRHIYKPMRKRGYGQLEGSVVVFFVSAFFHEYLVSIPLRMFKYWAFSGMLMQVPLAYMTGRFFKGTSGNVIMWVSLIVGQPVAILAYVHDYYLTTVVSQIGNDTLHPAMHTEL
ncbi:hypothetical protein ACOMHN_034534 [Nucella lapillus]